MVVCFAARLAYSVSDGRYGTAAHAAKASKTWKQLCGMMLSKIVRATLWEWEEFLRFRINPGGVFYFSINPPTVKSGFW